jgi:peptidoglycan/LPS O-acetylase OafA/YrhL
VLANAAMLQDVLGIEALSAGVWYVAIDLQLYAMGVALLWLGARPPVARAAGPWAGPLLVCALGTAALYGLARGDAWEPWGLHYVGAWALGAAAWWAAGAPRAGWAWSLAAVAAGAWLIHGGNRLGVAVAVGIGLCAALRSGLAGRWPHGRAAGWLAERSYALFLVHYPVCLAVNAAVSAAFPGQPWPALAGFVLAWAASNVVAVAVHRWVERPASAARLSRRAGAPS